MSPLAHEFNISVTPLGVQDEYLVRTEWVAPGVPLAEEQVRWPVENWLAASKQLMNDPLLGLLQGGNAGATKYPPNLVALGQELHEALFKDSLRDSWMIAQVMAERDRSVLRLRLGLKGTRLPRLPWEVLHAGDRPLATGTDVAFSRYELTTGLRSQTLSPITHQNQPLRILMAIAGPTDQETLALKQEASHLQEELRSRSYNGLPPIELKLLEQPGREQLTQALEQGQYQVFHYAGHSNLGAAGGDLYLVNGKTGLTETLSGDDLAGLLVNNGVRMAVFNSCRSAYTAAEAVGENGRENLVQALVKRRIPGVLAMAERIPDEVALTLTRLFYRNLSQGYPIDLSLNRARQGLISAYGSNQLYWALPVLYLDPKFNGFLTDSYDPKVLELCLSLPDASEVWAVESEEPLFKTTLADRDSSFLDYEEDLDMPLEVGAEYDDLESADLDYEEDLAVVSDLFRQLSEANAATDNSAAATSRSQTISPSSKEVVTQKLLSADFTDSQANAQQQKIVATNNLESEKTPDATKLEHPGLLGFVRLSRDSKKGRRTRFKVPVVWGVLGATLSVAIALTGWWVFQNRISGPEAYLPKQTSLPSVQNPANIDLEKADTPAVTNFAIQQFSQNNIAAGSSAVEELLKPERNTVLQAEAALAAVPPQQQDNPAISFLKGRVAWQYMQAGNKKYSIDDAQRYWTYALDKQPNNPQYLTALGFAYYAQGKFDRANQVWFDALYQTSQNQAATAKAATSKEALTIYAGLALSFSKSAQTQPPDRRDKYANESVKMRQKVMAEDPVNFQPDALAKNWMWTEKAIQDWRSLQKQPERSS